MGDGSWHTVRAERRGHNLILSVDDGDGWRRNESLVSLLPLPAAARPPTPLLVDKHDGVSVGGIPEFSGVKLITVLNDLHDSEYRPINTNPKFLLWLSNWQRYQDFPLVHYRLFGLYNAPHVM